MSNTKTIFLPLGNTLTLSTDEFSNGFYYVKGNPGETSGPTTFLTPSQSVVLGPFNVTKRYETVAYNGTIQHIINVKVIEDPQEFDLVSLSDVNITNPLADDILVYDGTYWRNEFNTGGGGPLELNDLTDVIIVTPAEGEFLRYESGVWTNSDIVFFSGSYNDLTDKPVLFSGAYNDLTGKPVLFSGAYADLTGKPTLGTMAAETASNYSLTSAFAAVAFSGAYSALSGKPTLGTMAAETASNYSLTSAFAPVAFSGVYDDLTGKPTLYTDENVDDRVAVLMQNNNFIKWDYNDPANTLTPRLTIVQAIPGHYYPSGSFLGGLSESATTASVTTGTLYFVPFFLMANTTFTSIGIVSGGTVLGSINMGIYADNAMGKPTGSPLSGTQSGSVTMAANTFVSHTFSTPKALPSGLYWLAFTVSLTNQIFGSSDSGSGGNQRGSFGFGIAATPSSTSITLPVVGWRQTFVYNPTLPAVGTLTAILAKETGDRYVFLRAQ